MYFNYDSIEFSYDPFPVALAKPILSSDMYDQFVDSFPALELFESFETMGKQGHKYVLSEKENAGKYQDFVASVPLWRDFHAWIKSDDFCYDTLAMLQSHAIDLGYRRLSTAKRLKSRVMAALRGYSLRREAPLRARFEFSALPADGGAVVPHTDAPTKIVTMVVSIVRPGEWDPRHGGGTDINVPNKQNLKFNFTNQLAGFEDMELIRSYDYTPNQAVIFVKTFNSWHSVRPMTGAGSANLRRTLTVVIEAQQ